MSARWVKGEDGKMHLVLNGTPLTTEQDRLFGQWLWIWRGFFAKPDVVDPHADAVKKEDSAPKVRRREVPELETGKLHSEEVGS